MQHPYDDGARILDWTIILFGGCGSFLLGRKIEQLRYRIEATFHWME